MDTFSDIVKEFWNSRSKCDDFLWRGDLTKFNVDLILKYVNTESTILDLGAGDCRVALALADSVKHITAVDYVNVVDVSHSKITSIVANINDYNDNNKYDCILLFGVMNFIEDTDKIYSFCKSHLNSNGVLIVKHQCGIHNDVFVDTTIDGVKYQSFYRQITNDLQLIEKIGFNVDVIDPYPLECNKHKNTVFKAFICRLL